ncbi:MAG TPA: SAM-dependent methyltransferase, partial [Bacilli bacterium]|nr:SAM-dependent methyltransferase [Bacilli bacterium]
MSVYLQDPSKHEKWLAPHSLAWYEQLGRLTGQFAYPWRSTITEPSGETVFTEEVARMVAGKRVLDVG